jgi:Flp pilus assembly protein TadG
MNRPPARRASLDEKGTAILEFALVVPILFTLMFSTMEVYFVLFNWQQVQAVAIDTARCVGINSPKCSGGAGNYAATVSAPAHALGGLTAAMVAVSPVSTCGAKYGLTETQITITYPIGKALPLNFIPSLAQGFNLVGVACF